MKDNLNESDIEIMTLNAKNMIYLRHGFFYLANGNFFMNNDRLVSDDYIWVQYTEDGIPILWKSPNLKLYLDFCPSEYIKKDSPTPDSTFISSACAFVPIAKDSESKIKKFSDIKSKKTRMRYLNEVLEMIKQLKIKIASLCLIENEELHYKHGLSNIKNKMSEIRRTDIGKNAKEDKIISVSGALFSLYTCVIYFLLMVKWHDADPPQNIEVIIDRFPGQMRDNLKLFSVINSICYKNAIPDYEGNIKISMLGENEEDPSGLILADMMAHINASWITLVDVGEESNSARWKIEQSKQIPQYEKKCYNNFTEFNNFLVNEEKCFVAIAPHEMEKIYNLIRRGMMSGEGIGFSEISSNFHKGYNS